MPLNEEEKWMLRNGYSGTQSVSNLAKPKKVELNSLLKRKYLNNDLSVYSSIEYGGSVKSNEESPYQESLPRNQSELNIKKRNRQLDSSLMKSKAYHKLVIDQLNKKYLNFQKEKKAKMFVTELPENAKQKNV